MELILKLITDMSAIVNVKNLSKTFKVKIQKSGLKGTFKSLLKPEFNISHAVKGISFQIEKEKGLPLSVPKRCREINYNKNTHRHTPS